MFVASLIFAFQFAASPEPFVVSLSDDADEFLVDADLDGLGDIAVLNGYTLTVYPTSNRAEPLVLQLPHNARALDITPQPRTGKVAVLAACGSEIRLFTFGGVPDGQLLFEHQSYLSEGDRPYRTVMVFEREGESLFFLPSADAIELRTWSGELRERIEPEPSSGAQRFEKIVGTAYTDARIGGADAIEFRVDRSVGNEPAFIEEQRRLASELENTSSNMWQIVSGDPSTSAEVWPWFALQPGIENSPRVRCTLRVNPSETHVRIDTMLSGAGTGGIGPDRRYPGMVTRLNAELPDFNGDGYTDLLLWNTDRPSVSPATIARMTLQQDWPIRLTAHVFDPKTNRFTAKPFASLSVRATWDLLLRQTYGSPLVHTVVKDLNADGRTDVGFSVDDRTYLRWMMDESGPRVDSFELDEPIERVSFDHPLDNTGRVTIGLRTQSALYVLDPE